MSKAQGHGDNDQALFVMACMTGMADSPPDSPEQEKRSWYHCFMQGQKQQACQ